MKVNNRRFGCADSGSAAKSAVAPVHFRRTSRGRDVTLMQIDSPTPALIRGDGTHRAAVAAAAEPSLR